MWLVRWISLRGELDRGGQLAKGRLVLPCSSFELAQPAADVLRMLLVHLLQSSPSFELAAQGAVGIQLIGKGGQKSRPGTAKQ